MTRLYQEDQFDLITLHVVFVFVLVPSILKISATSLVYSFVLHAAVARAQKVVNRHVTVFTFTMITRERYMHSL